MTPLEHPMSTKVCYSMDKYSDEASNDRRIF
uniref:Uncharacterized protein n=1 Tax=Arundo donax TaxID=35708 RepID=A0A0A9HD13_ARUDO